jgi:hypothetical protein
MATSGIANQFHQHALEIALSIRTYIMSSNRPDFGASVTQTNLEILSLVTGNTPSRITTYIEHSAIPTAR